MSPEGIKKYILVVDDEPKNVELFIAKLSGKNYRAIGAGSGQEAVTQIKTEKPGLVLLDIMMPGMNGFETLQKIKEIDKGIPVIMVTSLREEKEALKCMDLGAGAYITKPVDIDHLEKNLYIDTFFKK